MGFFVDSLSLKEFINDSETKMERGMIFNNVD